MARLTEVVIDCRHAPSLARFWAEVLDDYDVLPYDQEETARLATLGLTPETDTNVAVGGPGPTFFFQQVDAGPRSEPTTGRRMHLDVVLTDRHADDEVERLKGLGATEFQDLRKSDGSGWVTMADPEGNLFCVQQQA